MTNKTVNVMDAIEVNVIEPPTPTPVDAVTSFNRARWFTLERLLYGILVLLAVGMRFVGLGEQPLNPLEVANAWPAWLTAWAIQAPNTPTPTSPLLYSLHTILFWITGGSDALARCLPALAGVAVVWLIWYWRDWLGRTTALFAAFLLALDPWQVAFSRLADGAILSVALGLLTLIGLTHWLHLTTAEAKQSRWQSIIAVSVGLLLVSGAQAWSFVPVIALFVFLFSRTNAATDEPMVADGEERTFFGFSRSALLLFVGAAVLGATGWLTRPEGLGLISSSLTVWLGELLGWSAVRYSFGWPFIRLLVDQPLLLIFGIIGLVQLWLAQSALASAASAAEQDGVSTVQILETPSAACDPQWSLFLILWLCWGLILALLPGRNPASLLMIELPLLLATAHLIDVILQQYRPAFASRESGLVVLMLVILLISALFWATAFVAHRQIDSTLAKTTLLIVALVLLLVVAFAFWSDRAQTRFVIGGMGGVLLLLLTIASSWQLNQQFDITHPNGFFAESTHPDVRRLATDIATLSAQRNGDANEAPLQVQMAAQPDPVLGWYLRNMHRLSWVLAPGATNDQALPMVITLSDKADTQDLLPKYMGAHYNTHVRWLPSALLNVNSDAQAGESKTDQYWSQKLQPFLRWMIHREVKPLPPADSVVLWVPAQDR
ncbi:MAG: glycosyltransferase family 39 protein [Caldilineaceae bacterium]